MRAIKPYSEDLPTRIVRAVEGGMSKSGAARLFGVSLSSVKRYLRIAQRGMSLAPRKAGEGRPRPIRARRNSLKRTSRNVRPLYCVRKASLPGAHHGQVPERLHRKAATQEEAWLQPKKRTTVGARERDEWLRAAWRVTLVREIALKRLVFVEEMGTNVSLHPLYAWSKRGARARCSVPRNRGPNTTLLASMTSRVWDLAWQWKARPLQPSSRPTSRKFSSRAFGVGSRWW